MKPNVALRKKNEFQIVAPDKFIFGKKDPFDPDKFTVSDPTGGSSWGLLSSPDAAEVCKRCARLEWRESMFRKYPNILKKKQNLAVWLFVGSLLLFPVFILFATPVAPFAFIAALVFLIVSYTIPNALKADLIKYALSKQRGWLYDPFPDVDDGKGLAKSYPWIFPKGSYEYVDDQMWGEYEHKGVKRKFHSGTYTFVTIHHDKNGSHEEPHPNYFFAVHLEKNVKSSFLLYPESFLSRMGQKFHSKEIDVESIDFNKTFAFKYSGSKEDNSLEITKVLSPAVQLQLLDLNKKGMGLSVLFDSDKIIFLFKGNMLKRTKTKLTGGFNIAKEDLDVIDDYMLTFNTIAGEIVSKL